MTTIQDLQSQINTLTNKNKVLMGSNERLISTIEQLTNEKKQLEEEWNNQKILRLEAEGHVRELKQQLEQLVSEIEKYKVLSSYQIKQILQKYKEKLTLVQDGNK